MNRVIKVAICDDEKYLCEGFKKQFEFFDEVEMTGIAYDSRSCKKMLQEVSPDVIMLDISMETQEAGIHLIPWIKEAFPEVKILVLTSYDTDVYIYEAFANGADDYCVKTISIERLVKKICDLMENKVVLESDIANKLVIQSRKKKASFLFVCNKVLRLTAGEYQFLKEMYYGGSYRSIAKKNCVQFESVKKMGHRVLQKMGSSNMRELIAEMKELRIFEFIDSKMEETEE